MTVRKRFLFVLLIISAFAIHLPGCTTTTAKLKPVQTPPNLVGTWKGEYRGSPIQMVVEKQRGSTVTAKFSSPLWSSSVHEPHTGTIGAGKDGSLWMAINIGSGRRAHEFVMRVVSDKRLEGTDESSHHYGEAIHFNRE